MGRDHRRSRSSAAGDSRSSRAGVVGTFSPSLESPGSGLIDWLRRDGRDVRRWTRPGDGLDVTLVGPAVVPGIPPAELAAWMGEAIAGPDPRPDRLRRVLNYWLLIVEEPASRAVHFATDPLGVYPAFLAAAATGTAFGCDVWEMQAADLIEDLSINYEAVAAWLVYSYDYSGGSVFEASPRLPPGRIVTFDPAGRRERDYCGFEAEARRIDVGAAAAELFRLVAENLEASVAATEGGIALALSGGLDSRLLLGLLGRRDGVDLVACTVEWDEAEKRAASMAAEVAGVRRMKIPVGKSLYDFFETWNRFSPEGFPARPDVVAEIARRYTPDRTIMHGFLGGPIAGARADDLDGRTGEGNREGLVDALLEHHAFSGLYMFRSTLRPAIREEATRLIEEVLAEGDASWRRLDVLRTNFYLRQRFYIAHNFIAHRDVSSALIPFYSHALLDFKFRHAIDARRGELYPEIFRRHLPDFADLPIDRTLRDHRLTSIWARSWFLRRQSVRQLSRMLAEDSGPVSRHASVPRLLARVLGYTKTNGWVFLLQRIERFERRLAEAGLDVEWARLAEPDASTRPARTGRRRVS